MAKRTIEEGTHYIRVDQVFTDDRHMFRPDIWGGLSGDTPVVVLTPGNRGRTAANGGYGLYMVYLSRRVRILAGCRDFSMAQAVKHWSSKDGRALRPHFLPLLAAGKVIAKQNGWRL